MYRRQVCNVVCRRNILFSEMGRAKVKEGKKGETGICVFAKFFGEMIKGKGRTEGKKDEGKKGVVLCAGVFVGCR